MMNATKRLPKRITGYCNSKKHLNIRYDKAVENKHRIPGLVEFLNCEYEQLLESKGSFILDNELSEKDMQPIPVILSSECPKDKKYRMDDDWVAKTIVRELQKCNSEKEYELAIKKVLSTRSFQSPISGMFFHNDNLQSKEDCDDFIPKGPYIELYYKNTFCSDEEDYKAWLSATLAHEFFHFLHDSYAWKEFNKTGEQKERVKESLADFFAYTYCLSKAEGIVPSRTAPAAFKRYAKRQLDTWQYRFGSKWPYAYAYCFLYGNSFSPVSCSDLLYDLNKSGCIEKFNYVLKRSKISMNYAYKELVWNVPYI